MEKGRGFREILKEQLEILSESPSETAAAKESPVFLGVPFLRLISGFIPPKTVQTPSKAYKTPPPLFTPPADLSPEQKAAYEVFVALGAKGPFLSSEKNLKRAYRELAKNHHPDSRPTAVESEKRMLQERFHQLASAYSTLRKYLIEAPRKAA